MTTTKSNNGAGGETSTQLAVGRRLAVTRQDRSSSQAAFAGQLGVSLRAYQNYERGESEISASLLVALYEVFDVEPLWVLTGLEERSTGLTESNLVLVSDVASKLESILIDHQQPLSSEKKARLLIHLIRYFHGRPEVNEGELSSIVGLMVDAE